MDCPLVSTPRLWDYTAVFWNTSLGGCEHSTQLFGDCRRRRFWMFRAHEISTSTTPHVAVHGGASHSKTSALHTPHSTCGSSSSSVRGKRHHPPDPVATSTCVKSSSGRPKEVLSWSTKCVCRCSFSYWEPNKSSSFPRQHPIVQLFKIFPSSLNYVYRYDGTRIQMP